MAIINVPFLDGDIPRATSYGNYISQLVRTARVSSHVADFNTCNKILTAKLLKQGYRYHKLCKAFKNSIDATTTWYPNLMMDSNLFLNKACRNPNFMLTYCIDLEKFGVDRNDFSNLFRKIIIRYKRTGYNMSVMQQTAFLMVNPNHGYICCLLNCTLAVGPQN